MNNPKHKPIVKQLNSSSGEFLETVEPETDPLFAVSSVASASDNTGIAVTPARTAEQAESRDSLSNKNVPSSAENRH